MRQKNRPANAIPNAHAFPDADKASLPHAAARPAAGAPEGLARGQDGRLRCFWAGQDALYQRYHDTEWGKPTGDDRTLFEKLCLEGFQAGLSWAIVLHKRAALRAAFDNFAYHRLAACANPQQKVAELMQNAALIRHERKLAAVFSNARAAARLAAEYGSLAAYLRRFLPPAAECRQISDLASYKAITFTPLSAKLAKDLKRRGFRFIGPVSAYAYMQSIGMVNDHIAGCFCRESAAAAQQRFYADSPG